MNIILASNNKNKLREVKEILLPLGINVKSQSEAGIDIEVDETGTTFEENAALKAEAVYSIAGCPVISDDSGLEVDALDGQPGVYSHRYAGPDATDKDRCKKLLDNLKDVKEEDRQARFVCAICYINQAGKKTLIRGTCEGRIGFSEKGENGFGYDPVFMLNDRSFAELSHDEKNKISHRADALAKLYEILKDEVK